MKYQLNELGRQRIPFLFIIDFDVQNVYIAPLASLDNSVYFSIDGFTNLTVKSLMPSPRVQLPLIKKKVVSLAQYQRAFNQVIAEMKAGNTYLLNLTFPTEIEIKTTLFNIFCWSHAQFKLYFKDQFITFSPERFIKIANNLITTYPMKGTIDAHLPQAREKILADEKEMAEHTMVVDLLRNDLAIVAKQVRVNRFRYIDSIIAGHKTLLQVSSEISGVLEKNWPERLGDILLSLLPAGSISGAPKKKTVEIIKAVENYQRGFFTGIFGYFDGQQLDSAVMIRFIEKHPGQLIYKSGGGITIDSDLNREYEEMLAKIYLPIHYHE